MLDLTTLDFEKGNGLVTVVAQDAQSGAVLMVAHADREALERTLATGEMHYRSRTRGLWRKGATSGNAQRVVSLSADCDGDAVLARVVPAGPACHTGAVSCFGVAALSADALGALDAIIARRAAALPSAEARTGPSESQPDHADAPDGGERGSPPEDYTTARRVASRNHNRASGGETSPSVSSRREGSKLSYTQRLLTDRNLRLKKIGEEAAELVTACADGDADRAVEEGADLLYHALVALHGVGVTLDRLRRVLAARASARAGRSAAVQSRLGELPRN